MNWFDWDRCPRIRTAVGDLFVDRDLKPSVFAEIVSNDRLFSALSDTVARKGRGRHFLSQVLQFMNRKDVTLFSTRIKIIERLMK